MNGELCEEWPIRRPRNLRYAYIMPVQHYVCSNHNVDIPGVPFRYGIFQAEEKPADWPVTNVPSNRVSI